MSKGSKAKAKAKKTEKISKPWKKVAGYKKTQVTEVHAKSGRSGYRQNLWNKQHG